MARPTYAEQAQAKKEHGKPVKVSPADIAAGVERIRVAQAFAMERANVLPDSVRLAAEQVQDVRIEMVERGPQVSWWEGFIPSMVTLCLESMVAGMLITKATRLLLKAPVVAHNVGKQPSVKQYRALVQQQQASKLVSRQLLALGQPDVDPYVMQSILEKFDGLAKAIAEEGGVPAAKAAVTWVQTISPPAVSGAEGNLDAGDTAGVSIQEATMNYASEQRLWINAVYAQLEGLFLSGAFDLKQLVEATTFDPVEDFAAARRAYKRFFEAAIWSALFRFGQKGGATIEEHGKYGGVPRAAALLVGPKGLFGLRDEGGKNLLDYWAHRFIDPDPKSGGKTFAEGRYPAEVLSSTFAHRTKTREFAYDEEKSPTWRALGRYLTDVGKELAERGPVLAAQDVKPSKRTR